MIQYTKYNMHAATTSMGKMQGYDRPCPHEEPSIPSILLCVVPSSVCTSKHTAVPNMLSAAAKLRRCDGAYCADGADMIQQCSVTVLQIVWGACDLVARGDHNSVQETCKLWLRCGCRYALSRRQADCESSRDALHSVCGAAYTCATRATYFCIDMAAAGSARACKGALHGWALPGVISG